MVGQRLGIESTYPAGKQSVLLRRGRKPWAFSSNTPPFKTRVVRLWEICGAALCGLDSVFPALLPLELYRMRFFSFIPGSGSMESALAMYVCLMNTPKVFTFMSMYAAQLCFIHHNDSHEHIDLVHVLGS